MNQRITALTQKEVSRKEFLGMAGLTVASLFGFGTVIKLVTGKSALPAVHQSSGYGYGNSTYGGVKRPAGL